MWSAMPANNNRNNNNNNYKIIIKTEIMCSLFLSILYLYFFCFVCFTPLLFLSVVCLAVKLTKNNGMKEIKSAIVRVFFTK